MFNDKTIFYLTILSFIGMFLIILSNKFGEKDE